MRDKVYFISDLHLGASYIEKPIDYERKVVRWLNSIKDSAKAIYLLGDILDYWYEYRNVVPRGYTRFLGTLATLADEGIEIHWYIGNHDIWIFDYLPNEIGMTVVDGHSVTEIDGKRFFLSHGDGIGSLKPGFRFIRSLFRNRFCQWLFSSVHPRWTVPFAHRWSSHSRKSAKDAPQFIGEEYEPFIPFARNWNNEHQDEQVDYFIFGHRHILLDYKIDNNSQVIVLGDWIHHLSYAVYDGNTLSLETFKE
ncbi:MAG: UDP-2,3-diacylglucosamine diphosphatase [Muribaculaceae bacterium]|nr:UDP-2,3-diacylglucosamine diphosphatase [Muribaculaceae bacterium]